MKAFSKPAINVAEQLTLLKARGLAIIDEERATQFLEVVSLFRLSPYMRPFQHADDSNHTFKNGSTLRQVVSIYRFDAEMRQLVMDAIGRVEIAMRACISNHMGPTYGAHWYLDKSHFKDNGYHERLLSDLYKKLDEERQHFRKDQSHINGSQTNAAIKAQRIENRKRDNYARFYGATYDQPPLPPTWAMLEDLTMGSLSKLYQSIARDTDRKAIAKRFQIAQEVLGSWLHTLTFIRNCCAHHSRLWNRELAVPPKIPKSAEWQLPNIPRDQPDPVRRLFIVLTMLSYLMKHISPDIHWRERLIRLLNDYPDTSHSAMGFPDGWQQMKLWNF